MEHSTSFTLAGAGAAPAAAGRAAVATTAMSNARRMRRVNACRTGKLRAKSVAALRARPRLAQRLPPIRVLAPARTCCAAAEALDAPAGVHELLTARVERMAVRADLDMQLRLRGTGPELVAAGAADVRGAVLRMNVCLHCPYESSRRLLNPPRTTRAGASTRCSGGRSALAAAAWPSRARPNRRPGASPRSAARART